MYVLFSAIFIFQFLYPHFTCITATDKLQNKDDFSV